MNTIEGHNPDIAGTTKSKTILMPTADEMRTRLQAAKLYGDDGLGRILDKFIGKVAGTGKVGEGLYMAWQLSIRDAGMNDGPAAEQVILDMLFNQVINALQIDTAVAETAKKFREEVLAKLRGM